MWAVILIPPITPMLAEAWPELPSDRALPGGLSIEQKPDGYRALLFARSGHVFLQSRNGTDLAPAFPEVTAATLALDRACSWTGGSSLSTTADCTSERSRISSCRAPRPATPATPPVWPTR
jgi:hypothetical protein